MFFQGVMISFSNSFVFTGSSGHPRDLVISMVGLDVVEAVERMLVAAQKAHGM